MDVKKENLALLDADFISKCFVSCAESDHLIDRVLSLPNYEFFCHEQIRVELSRNESQEPSTWLQTNITAGRVTCLSDGDIIEALHELYGDSSRRYFVDFLKEACAPYGMDFYRTYYADLDVFTGDAVGFLELLKQGDEAVGIDNNLGEIKTAVLFQMLMNLHGQQAYIFCSDDRHARKRMILFEDVRCLSVLSVFLRLKEDCGLSKEEAKPYFDSYTSTLEETQTTFRVIEAGRVARTIRVPIEDVFNHIFENKFTIRQDGMLRYLAA